MQDDDEGNAEIDENKKQNKMKNVIPDKLKSFPSSLSLPIESS
jgi:hypothetical protein